MMKNDMHTLTDWRRDRYIAHSRIFIALCLTALCFLSATESFAKNYSFAWSANPEPVTGYKLYYKKSDVPVQTFSGTGSIEGASVIDVGKKTAYTISGLEENATYYFALRAYSGTDESENTNIITTHYSDSPGNLAPQAIAGKLSPAQATVATPKEFTIATTTSITQHGITWTFAEPVVSGQFVNGDYWVVDSGSGIKIVNISPGYTLHPTTRRPMNGSMINPHNMPQGYDGLRDYLASKNVGIGISNETPLITHGSQSLVSTISNVDDAGINHKSYVKVAAVLTSLSSIPPQGTFRPGISAETKTLHNENNLDYSKLKNLPVPTGVIRPNISTYTKYFQMVWLDHGDWTTRFTRPSDGIPENYYFPQYFTNAALMLHLNYTNAEKRSLLINFIQFGIDMYSFIESGKYGELGLRGWTPNGGNNNGRKWPIMFSGIMLNYAPMRDIGQKSGDHLYSDGHGPANIPEDYISFGEDGQTFYVKQSDVDVTNGPKWAPDKRSAPNYPYTSAMIGMPEWGIAYAVSPKEADSSWNAMYRTIATAANVWAGDSIAIRLMDAKSLWNHDAYFDYIDRYMAISKGLPDPFGFTVDRQKAGARPTGLIGKMYDTYRVLY